MQQQQSRKGVAWLRSGSATRNADLLYALASDAAEALLAILTCFMHLRWAADPTRDTDRPTEMAGRWPW